MQASWGQSPLGGAVSGCKQNRHKSCPTNVHCLVKVDLTLIVKQYVSPSENDFIGT